MGRKSREEKTIEHASTTVDDLEKLYNKDGRAVVEYLRLYNEYKKLYKRFNKTIHMNDSVGKSVIIDNTELKKNVDYTIKTARDKIIHNVAEHRKTKETLEHLKSDKKTKESKLKKKLDEAYLTIAQLQAKINRLEKHDTDYSKVFEKQNIIENINISQYKEKSITDLIEHEIKSANLSKKIFTIAKITVDNFDDLQYNIEEHSSIKGFLKSSLKYLQSICSKNDIVFYSHHNVFYIIFKDSHKDDIKKKIEQINQERTIGGTVTTFSIGISEFNFEDSVETLLSKVSKANEEAYFIQKGCSVVYK